MNQGKFWKSNLLISSGLTLLFVLAYLNNSAPLQRLELLAYDHAMQARSQAADERIIIIDIDDESITQLGRWPWPRSVIGKMIGRLSSAGAHLVGLDILYSEAAQAMDSPELKDENRILIDAVRKSGNTLMPMLFETGESNASAIKPGLTDDLNRMSISQINLANSNSIPPSASNLRYPFPQLSRVAAGLGHINVFADNDGVVRTEQLAMPYAGKYFPSMSLALAAKAMNIPVDDLRINLGLDIELGAKNIGTDAQIRLLPAFFASDSDNGFSTYSFADVHSGRIDTGVFRDKLVLIGVTAAAISQTLDTPVNANMAQVEFIAQVLQSILHETFFLRPVWAGKVELALLLLIGLYLSVGFNRLNPMINGVISALALILLLGGNLALLTTASLWLQTISAACLLLIGHLLLTTRTLITGKKARKKATADSNETNKVLGLSFQSQGMLDMAFEKFCACQANDEMLSILYNLALDFERKRMFDKAIAVYEYMVEHDSSYKDAQVRLANARKAEKSVKSGANTIGGFTSQILEGDNLAMLGRYKIIKELGKGAMGAVYLGRDPKINREVAIKTMALSQEFELDELKEVKERFFHEAEIAGMLNHPNIVTIFDAGEEHDLAYIAMEFLDGMDLATYTKPNALLPLGTTLKIIGKIAEALQYAHSQDVIHRDIKPANIMILKNKTVKVTDFGIAHITACSRTRAGIVMGTPSYMSPEQLAGKNISGRSDLFSLGVMFYELACGVRPFKADSISKLMYQIAKKAHPDIRQFNPDLPESVIKLIDRMLAKKPENRIASGNDVIQGVLHCLRDIRDQGDSR